jgi:hypothetical protein
MLDIQMGALDFQNRICYFWEVTDFHPFPLQLVSVEPVKLTLCGCGLEAFFFWREQSKFSLCKPRFAISSAPHLR